MKRCPYCWCEHERKRSPYCSAGHAKRSQRHNANGRSALRRVMDARIAKATGRAK